MLWSSRIALRHALELLTANYPCDEFEGIAWNLVEQGFHIDYLGWFAAYPRMQGQLRGEVVSRARKFNQPYVAIPAALVWARYFGGGDEAYRAVALAINRRDRVYVKRREVGEDFVRHDLNDHGTVTYGEAITINGHLDALGAARLDLAWIAARGWWKLPPPELVRDPSRARVALELVTRACSVFAAIA